MALFKSSHKLILASASPRRKELIASLGLDFTVSPAENELMPQRGERPELYAQNCARGKARDVLAKNLAMDTMTTIISADTVVTLAGKIYGKPRDAKHAGEILRELRGQTHEVITACCLLLVDPELSGVKEVCFQEATKVSMGQISDAALDNYAACGEPMDKAGAYAIQGQGSFMVSAINGSWSNVVGLPLAQLCSHLLENNCIVPA